MAAAADASPIVATAPAEDRAAPAPAPADAPAPDAPVPDARAQEAPDAGPAPDIASAGVDAAAVEPPPVGAPTGTVAQLANWIAAAGDNAGRPFAIVDKQAADVFVFDADGRLQGASAVLVGLARGDDSAPGVGDRDLSAIEPDDRTTPAGRFVAGFGAASGHRTVLWVDYADAISLHPVVTSNPKERRLERLRSPVPEDRRITYGCINVPRAFYADVVLKTFAGGAGVVYILPDTKPLDAVFPAFVAAAGSGGALAGASSGASPGPGPDAAPAAPNASP